MRYLLVFALALSGAGAGGLSTNLTPSLKGSVVVADKAAAKDLRNPSVSYKSASYPEPTAGLDASNPINAPEPTVVVLPSSQDRPPVLRPHLQLHSGQSPPDDFCEN